MGVVLQHLFPSRQDNAGQSDRRQKSHRYFFFIWILYYYIFIIIIINYYISFPPPCCYCRLVLATSHRRRWRRRHWCIGTIYPNVCGRRLLSSQFSTATGESIRGIDYGRYLQQATRKLLLWLFSGRVISLTTESLVEKESTDKYGRSKGQVRRESKLKSLSGSLSERYHLVDALQEIVGQQNYDFLDKKYYDILKTGRS